jgi:Putative transmembrane protein (Alph_Pro_TM)
MGGLKKYGRNFLAGLILIQFLPFPARAAGGKLEIRPERVTISAFFSGARLDVTCDLPPGSQAVLRVRGERIEQELMRKTHHWDLWMNTGEVDIDHAPQLFIALSSDPRLLSPGAGRFPWTYDALEREAKFSGQLKPSERDTIFKEFVQLKERDELYRLYPGGLKINQAGPDQWQAQASVHLPSRLKPGPYHVALWILRDGTVTERRDSSFQVLRQGLPAFLHGLAVGHGVFYGFLAVALAMVVGMLTGLAFHRRGAAH